MKFIYIQRDVIRGTRDAAVTKDATAEVSVSTQNWVTANRHTTSITRTLGRWPISCCSVFLWTWNIPEMTFLVKQDRVCSVFHFFFFLLKSSITIKSISKTICKIQILVFSKHYIKYLNLQHYARQIR